VPTRDWDIRIFVKTNDGDRTTERRRRIVVFILFALLSICWSAGSAQARSLIIYYANETVPEVLSSRNYQALLSILDGMRSEAGSTAAQALRTDALLFRGRTLKDIESLQRISSVTRSDLAVFTNTLALQHKYMATKAGIESSHSIDIKLSTSDPVMQYSPLSSQQNFGIAIAAALRGYTKSDSIALIVNSHGTKNLAVMPRLPADFTSSNATDLRQQMDDLQANELAVPSVELRGIKKGDLWNELGLTAKAEHVHFSLVFLESCESAASTWKEYFAIPSSVRSIAHTGFAYISPDQFDYLLLLSSVQQAADHDLPAALTRFLRRSEVVYIDSRYTYWRWPLLITAASLPSFIYFTPLTLWGIVIATSGYSRRKAKSKRRMMRESLRF
jgi:hypothetical protein